MMMVLRQKLGGLGKNERGFTLPEVMITIVILGIILAITSSSWCGVARWTPPRIKSWPT